MENKMKALLGGLGWIPIVDPCRIPIVVAPIEFSVVY